MANNFPKIKKGFNTEPTTGSTVTIKGDIAYNSSTDQVEVFTTTAESITTASNTQTLTNKTISGGSSTGGTITVSDSNFTIQDNGDATKQLKFEASSIGTGTTATLTSPPASTTLVGTDSTQTLTNKGIDATSNTITNITNTEISASAAIVDTKLATISTAGKVSNSATTATSANTTSAIVARDGSGNFSAGTITAALSGNATTATTATNVSGTVAIANGGTGQTSKAAAFDALSPMTTGGDLIYGGTSGTGTRLANGTFGQVLTSAGSTSAPSWTTVPQGLKNYVITNAGIEQGTTSGYSLGTVTLTNNFPSGAPSFGSGASGSLSIAAVSSGQLAGLFSLNYSSIAATTAGNFVATDAFTVDLEGQAKVMQFSFFYQYQSGTINFSGTSSNSFGVAIYDVTNSQFIQPAGVFNLVQNSGVGKASGTFQTSSNGTSYRLVIYNANATGAGPMSIYLDDFFVGPQITAAGAAASDWQSYSMTITGSSSNPTKGTTTTDLAYWRRVGDSMEVTYTLVQSGAGSAGSGTYLFSLPSGTVIDSSKVVVSTTTFRGHIGVCHISNSTGSSARFQGNAFAYDTTHIALGVTSGSISDWNAVGSANAPLSDAAQVITFRAVVPISGWSSNTVMSNDTDTRGVAARYKSSAGNSFTGASVQVVDYATKDYDTHAAVTTGSGWKFTAPVSGKYSVKASFSIGSLAWTAGNRSQMALFKNGSLYCNLNQVQAQATASYAMVVVGSDEIDLNAGDFIDIRNDCSQNGTYSSSTDSMHIAVERLSGPATIAATESVNARYFASATSLSGSLVTISWTTKDFDSHNAMSSGTYTVPVSGKYQVNTNIAISGTFALNNQNNLVIQKNGTTVSEELDYAAGAETSAHVTLSDIISCLAGDTLRVQLSSGATTPAIVSSNTKNFISISRVGN